jgi:hypothetical protein
MVMCAPVKSLLPGHRCQTGSGYRTSPTNCDDPVHGGGLGETHLLWGPGETHLADIESGTREVLYNQVRLANGY